MLTLQKMPEASTARFRPEPWIHLIEQLDVILAIVQSGDSNPVLRRFGARRRSAMHRRLMLERRRLIAEITVSGHVVVAMNPMPDAPAPPRDLDVEFKRLGDAFDLCAQDLSPLTQAALQDWLTLRSHMHREHARFFRAY